ILYGYVYAHTYSEAKQKRDAAIISWNERNHTVLHTSSPITFGNLFDEWMHLIRHTVKESSYCLYMTIMEKHLCPYFGNVKLADFYHLAKLVTVQRAVSMSGYTANWQRWVSHQEG
ncbi:MAG: hypothetical protein K2L40_01245, partial [Lactobacillus sp.]|nr:hypothetical protein [Lactobacillus sp.]